MRATKDHRCIASGWRLETGESEGVVSAYRRYVPMPVPSFRKTGGSHGGTVVTTGNTSPPGHTHHHHHHHLLPQHLKIKMEGTDTEYSAVRTHERCKARYVRSIPSSSRLIGFVNVNVHPPFSLPRFRIIRLQYNTTYKVEVLRLRLQKRRVPGFGCTFQSLSSDISHSRRHTLDGRFTLDLMIGESEISILGHNKNRTLDIHVHLLLHVCQRILDDDLTRGNGGSSSFEARLVSIVHGTMNTSDSIHLQAARRTPREDLELYCSDGACRHSLALTQYATVPRSTLAFNPPSQILRSREYRFKATSISLSPTTSCTLTAKTSRHHWGRIELSFNDWPPLLQEQNVVPREYHFGVVFCIACSIRPTWLQRGRNPDPSHVRCLYGVIWSISEGGYEAVGSTVDVQSNVSPPGTTYDSGARTMRGSRHYEDTSPHIRQRLSTDWLTQRYVLDLISTFPISIEALVYGHGWPSPGGLALTCSCTVLRQHAKCGTEVAEYLPCDAPDVEEVYGRCLHYLHQTPRVRVLFPRRVAALSDEEGNAISRLKQSSQKPQGSSSCFSIGMMDARHTQAALIRDILVVYPETYPITIRIRYIDQTFLGSSRHRPSLHRNSQFLTSDVAPTYGAVCAVNFARAPVDHRLPLPSSEPATGWCTIGAVELQNCKTLGRPCHFNCLSREEYRLPDNARYRVGCRPRRSATTDTTTQNRLRKQARKDRKARKVDAKGMDHTILAVSPAQVLAMLGNQTKRTISSGSPHRSTSGSSKRFRKSQSAATLLFFPSLPGCKSLDHGERSSELPDRSHKVPSRTNHLAETSKDETSQSNGPHAHSGHRRLVNGFNFGSHHAWGICPTSFVLITQINTIARQKRRRPESSISQLKPCPPLVTLHCRTVQVWLLDEDATALSSRGFSPSQNAHVFSAFVGENRIHANSRASDFRWTSSCIQRPPVHPLDACSVRSSIAASLFSRLLMHAAADQAACPPLTASNWFYVFSLLALGPCVSYATRYGLSLKEVYGVIHKMNRSRILFTVSEAEGTQMKMVNDTSHNRPATNLIITPCPGFHGPTDVLTQQKPSHLSIVTNELPGSLRPEQPGQRRPPFSQDAPVHPDQSSSYTYFSEFYEVEVHSGSAIELTLQTLTPYSFKSAKSSGIIAAASIAGGNGLEKMCPGGAPIANSVPCCGKQKRAALPWFTLGVHELNTQCSSSAGRQGEDWVPDPKTTVKHLQPYKDVASTHTPDFVQRTATCILAATRFAISHDERQVSPSSMRRHVRSQRDYIPLAQVGKTLKHAHCGMLPPIGAEAHNSFWIALGTQVDPRDEATTRFYLQARYDGAEVTLKLCFPSCTAYMSGSVPLRGAIQSFSGREKGLQQGGSSIESVGSLRAVLI
ncbi:uncharacterized protein CLUP02_18006 [Colletotrichum lupini]|uniref:Uncharacterized protein n=1 Tax=Colletotrichum lupini TaxID=145971 RepID=A0A9Q8WAC2_9PEZI|nr:uncharacterized protein CLUP02_18006 [Colletotrichum lupini]UQC76493.1 hypothetical protein CLUP02_18006 [Colletotrichum lupini]